MERPRSRHLAADALWWASSAYAWLTNTLDPTDALVAGATLVAMGAMFIAALAIPDAFGPHGLLFAVAYLIVIVMQLALYVLSGRSGSVTTRQARAARGSTSR